MDVRELKQLLSSAATGSLILLGSGSVLAGNRPHEQPTRPHMSAACSPNWGFNQTCWSRFPAVPECPSQGFDAVPGTYGNSLEQPTIYTPQHALLLPDSRLIAPESGSIESPISIFPNSSPAATDGGASGFPGAPSPSLAPPSSEVSPPLVPLQPLNRPEIPDLQAVPPEAGQPPANTLPPLPAPPMPPIQTPDQSHWHRSYRSPGSGQLHTGFTPAAPHGGQTSSRYGNVPPSAALISPSFLTSAPNANARSMPIANVTAPNLTHRPMKLASQSRFIPNPPNLAVSYRNAAVIPSATAVSELQFGHTQLPQMQNYQTIPSESLRGTP